eukprot:7589852-Karenia_brevis.AAC.1
MRSACSASAAGIPAAISAGIPAVIPNDPLLCCIPLLLSFLNIRLGVGVRGGVGDTSVGESGLP